MITAESLAIQPNVYYTTEEASELLRVARQTVMALLESGSLHGVKIDSEWRVLGAALLNLSVQGRHSESDLVADWLAASTRSLAEVWDNEEDSVYDQL